ncbi:MAG: ECF transporter S component [Oscillospiraceae bacterium]
MKNSNVKANRKNILMLVETALLTAIILVMTFTKLGYIAVGPLVLSVMMVPVTIGAISLGPWIGAFLGLVFGVTSFMQCFMGDVLGSILVSSSMFKTFIVCIVPRVLAGLLTGLIFKACAKVDQKKGWSYVVTSICGPLLNTVFFLGFLAIFFWGLKFTPEQSTNLGGVNTVLQTVIAIALGINAPIEVVVGGVLSSGISKALAVAMKKMKI